MSAIIEDYLSLSVEDIDMDNDTKFRNIKGGEREDRKGKDREKVDREAGNIQTRNVESNENMRFEIRDMEDMIERMMKILARLDAATKLSLFTI